MPNRKLNETNLNTHATNSPAVVLIVVVRTRVDVRAVEVQIVSVVVAVRRRRPVVAVATTIVHRATVDVAGIEEEVTLGVERDCLKSL